MNTAVYSPSKYQVGKIYLQRFFNWRRNSSPYISGDACADMCDFVYNPPRFRSFIHQRNSLKDAKTIFVRGVDFYEFIEEHSSELFNKVVLAGNSDFEFLTQIDANLFDAGNIFFLQNSFISDSEKVFTLPIGIENLRWGLNGKKKLLEYIPIDRRKNKILFGPFGNTHEIRKEVVEKFVNERGSWTVIEGYIDPNKYVELASEFRYVACVRGNGIDTHRLWETLYRGAIPVVQRDKWSESLSYLGLPIRMVDSWSVKNIESILDSNLKDLNLNPFELEPMWMAYWVSKIKG
jgi:hypothetical protein